MDDDDRVLAYVQGRLDQAARSDFEQEMVTRPALRAEVTALEATRGAFAAEQDAERASDDGWERLSRSIEAERAPANLNRRPMLAQFAAVAIGAIAIWQFLAVPFLPGQDSVGFTPVSEATAETVLRVGFADGATAAELTALLAEVGGRIVDGPSAVGLFTLAFEDDAARDAAEALLADRTGLVLVVSRP